MAACRFLDHLVDRGFSPHTICAYAYDLRRLFTFLAAEGMDWRAFRGPDALRLLAFLRRAPSRRPAQRLGLTVVVGGPEAQSACSCFGEPYPGCRLQLLRLGGGRRGVRGRLPDAKAP
ncbi:site-specific integrase [Streptomyces sp. NPDC005969]|uniref:site-specific integrase n=1 Tax=Streptomyces sp. NPDC005969 TaxID=3156722 RepID=UPI0033D24B72